MKNKNYISTLIISLLGIVSIPVVAQAQNAADNTSEAVVIDPFQEGLSRAPRNQQDILDFETYADTSERRLKLAQEEAVGKTLEEANTIYEKVIEKVVIDSYSFGERKMPELLMRYALNQALDLTVGTPVVTYDKVNKKYVVTKKRHPGLLKDISNQNLLTVILRDSIALAIEYVPRDKAGLARATPGQDIRLPYKEFGYAHLMLSRKWLAAIFGPPETEYNYSMRVLGYFTNSIQNKHDTSHQEYVEVAARVNDALDNHARTAETTEDEIDQYVRELRKEVRLSVEELAVGIAKVKKEQEAADKQVLIDLENNRRLNAQKEVVHKVDGMQEIISKKYSLQGGIFDYEGNGASEWVPAVTDPGISRVEALEDGTLFGLMGGKIQVWNTNTHTWDAYIKDAEFSDFAITQNGIVHAISTADHGIYMYDPNTEKAENLKWTPISTGLTFNTGIAIDSEGNDYAIGTNNVLYRRQQGTTAWVAKVNGLTSVAVSPNATVYGVGATDHFAYRVDGQTLAQLDPPGTDYNSMQMQKIVVDAHQKIYGLAIDGHVYGLKKTGRWTRIASRAQNSEMVAKDITLSSSGLDLYLVRKSDGTVFEHKYWK